MKPLKLSIGIRPSRAMFRLSTVGGSLIDELLSTTESSKTFKKIFKHVEQDGVKHHFRLVGDDHNFFVGINDIQYSIDNYDSKNIIDIDKEVERFISLFAVVNNSLKIKDIRRMGMVCEYRLSSNTEQPSKELIEKLTKFKTEGYPAKFSLQFEQRTPITNTNGLPDFRNQDFWNVIENIYDGEVDADHSAQKMINLMLDVQRYYHPFLNEKAENAIKALAEKYKKQYQIFIEKNKLLGIVNGNE